MRNFKMIVSKKVDGKYLMQGSVDVAYPLLMELGIPIEPKGFYKDNENTETITADGTGFPVYDDEKVQYTFDSVIAAVKAQARNKLESGTAKLKPGLSIATTVAELLESGGNTGAALQVLRDMLQAFKAFLTKTGKSDKVQAAIYELVRNKNVIALQAEDKKAKLKGYIEQFAATLTAEQAAAWERHLIAVSEACDTVDALDEM